MSISPTADRLTRPHVESTHPLDWPPITGYATMPPHAPRQHRQAQRAWSLSYRRNYYRGGGYWPTERCRIQSTHTRIYPDRLAHCVATSKMARVRSHAVPRSLRPPLILASGLKHRTPKLTPFSRQHSGKSEQNLGWLVGRLVVAEQSIRTPLNLQEVWQRGPAPTPLSCSSQQRVSNGDFLRLHYGHGRYCSTTDGMCFLHVCPGHTWPSDRIPCPTHWEGSP